MSLSPIHVQLIDTARSAVGYLRLPDESSAGDVGAAIRTAQGNTYTGVCVDLKCGLGFCAEINAIGEMLTHKETQIEAVVAVTERAILPPCGRCRETMVQLDARNLDCTVILAEDRAVRMEDLLPDH